MAEVSAATAEALARARVHDKKRNQTEHRKAWFRARYHALTPRQKKARQAKAEIRRRTPRGRDNTRARQRKYGYGLGREAMVMMLERQSYRCAIPGCLVTLDGGSATHVDHDALGVRGLLCKTHNVGLGMFGDTVAGLRSALQYLEMVRP